LALRLHWFESNLLHQLSFWLARHGEAVHGEAVQGKAVDIKQSSAAKQVQYSEVQVEKCQW
jgi:hypothetical protein